MKNSKFSRTGEIHQQLVASTRRNYALVSAAYPLCSRLVVWSSEIGLSGLYCTYVHYLRSTFAAINFIDHEPQELNVPVVTVLGSILVNHGRRKAWYLSKDYPSLAVKDLPD
ncbi:hypothetical protein AFLA_013505 [Aspergillus flavus NRRL3357]|nr:hypothetical protein AFLA_013505 [Aspergillus flavus NRRL3357]